MRWYVKVDGKTFGPLEDNVIASWIRERRIGQTTRIAVEGADRWTSIAQSPFAGYLHSSAQFQASPPGQSRLAVKSKTPTGVRWILAIGVVVLWVMSATGWFGVAAGLGIIGLTLHRHRQGKRSVVGIAFPNNGAISTTAITVGLGVLFSMFGVSALFAAHEVTVEKERDAVKLKANSDQLAKEQKALLQQVPSKIMGWRTRLEDALKNNDPAQGAQLAATVRDEVDVCSKGLGDLVDPELASFSSDAAHQAATLKRASDLTDSVKQTDLNVASGKSLTQEQRWVDADAAYQRAASLVEQVMGEDETVKRYLPKDFDARKKLAEINRLRQSIASSVALETQRTDREAQKRQQDAEDNDPSKVKESCLTLSEMFGTSSKLSDLQKESLWPTYKGKKFAWNLQITEVSSGTFGGYTVQAKCAPESPSLVQDIQISYESDAKSLVMQLSKGSIYKLRGTLTSTSTLFGLGADGTP